MSAPSTSAVTFSRIPPRRSTTRAATWWGRAWVRAVEEASYSDSDLHAARALSRSGAIGGITLGHGSGVAACFHPSPVWAGGAARPARAPLRPRAVVRGGGGRAGPPAAPAGAA